MSPFCWTVAHLPYLCLHSEDGEYTAFQMYRKLYWNCPKVGKYINHPDGNIYIKLPLCILNTAHILMYVLVTALTFKMCFRVEKVHREEHSTKKKKERKKDQRLHSRTHYQLWQLIITRLFSNIKSTTSQNYLNEKNNTNDINICTCDLLQYLSCAHILQ